MGSGDGIIPDSADNYKGRHAQGLFVLSAESAPMSPTLHKHTAQVEVNGRTEQSFL